MSKRFLSGINVTGTATLNTVANAGLDTDKFLVLDAAGNVDYRTGAELRLDIGADVVSKVQHEVKLGATMTIGTPVYVPLTQDSGTNMTVLKASNASEATSSKTMGLIASSGITNDLVQVVTEGLLEGINTGSAIKGDPVWLGVDGALIFGLANKPVAPAHLVFLGIVTRAQTNNGEIFVKVQNGFEMNELHNYAEGSVQNNEVIVYESATSLYKPKSIPTILGYTPVPDSRTITINGTTYDLSANRSWTVSANQNARTEYEFTTDGTTATYSAVYSVGQVDVFYNGSKLASTEFTATNGTSVTLGFTPPSGQLVEVVAWETGGGVSNGRTLTINGVAYDLSANRSWTIDNASLGAQPQLNGTGLVRMSGTTVSYDNATYATQSYVTTAVSNLVNSAPSTLDTLNELATALGNDANFATTVTNSIATKLPLSGGTLTGRLTINLANNYAVLMNRPATTNYIGLQYQTSASNKWFVGLRENSTNNYIIYNEVLGADAFTISTTNNSGTFSGAYGTLNGVNINGATYATLNSNRGASSASAGVNYSSLGTQKWFTGIYENTDNFGFYNTTLNGFPIIVSTSGLTTFTKSDSSYGQVRLIGSSVESSIGFRYPTDGDATSWVIGKGAGTSTSHFGFYYGGTRMVLSPSGNLGLGVDAPTYGKLQVESTGTTAYFQGGNGGYAALAFSGNNGALVGVLTTFGGLVYLGRSNGTLGNAFGSQTDIVIDSTGNVGIGQTPLQALGTTLTVNGTIVSQSGAGGGNYNENFRANRTGNGYSAIAMGGANGTVSGTGTGVWTMAATPVGLGYRFDFDYAGSTVIAFATNGSITNSTGSYGTISDIRLKENITDASPKLENISKLKVRNFNLIGEDLKQIGFIAQEIEEVFPNMVDTNTKGIKSVKTTVLIPMLVKSVQELKAENDELRAILKRNNII